MVFASLLDAVLYCIVLAYLALGIDCKHCRFCRQLLPGSAFFHWAPHVSQISREDQISIIIITITTEVILVRKVGLPRSQET